MSRSGLVARNVLVTLATQLVSWVLAIIVTIYLPKYLNDGGLGAITLAGSFAAIFSVFVSLGTSTVLVTEIARDHSQTGEMLSATLLIRTLLGVLAILLGWLGAVLFNYSSFLQLLIVVALIAMMLGQVNEALSSALRGLEDFTRQNAAALTEKVISSILTVALVFLRAPIWMFVAVAMIGTAFSIAINLSSIRLYTSAIHVPQWATVRAIIRAGTPFLTAAVFVAIYGQSDALLLSKLSSVEAIGWYGLSKRLGGTTMVIPVALASAMLPTLTRMYKEAPLGFDHAVRRMFNLMLISVVPFAALLMLAPGKIISLLHYPPSFQNSIPVLIIMGAAIVLWFLSQAAGTVLIASDRQDVFSRVTGIAALISIPLCAACIFLTQRWLKNGAIGAMVSDVIIEAYMVTSYILALPGEKMSWKNFSVLGRAVAAVLPLVGLVYLMQQRQDAYLALFGLIMYVPLCWRLGCFDPRDIEMIRQLILRKTKVKTTLSKVI